MGITGVQGQYKNADTGKQNQRTGYQFDNAFELGLHLTFLAVNPGTG